MERFSELKLPESLDRALADMGFQTPTPIQAQAIPLALTGRDLIGCAQTGTGKTAAFGIPALTLLLHNRDRDALILVPTRELAAQVAEVIEKLSAHLPEIRTAILIGGVSMKPQLKALARKPRIIVATPGRLLDHLRGRSASLARTGMLVLDEADRMLDLGFAPQLQAILRFLPRERQTLLFSATLPPDIERLARDYLRNPQRVQVGPVSQAVPKIEQKIRDVNGGEKNSVLLDELNTREGTVLVFARTQHRTDRVARYLESYGVEVARIHGGRSQGQRNRALDGFRDGTFRVLVATDIAARGIDIDHVAHVINYDLPNVPEDYIHRIGRTGRAGRSGEAISLISHEERPLWKDIQKLLGSKGSSVTKSTAPMSVQQQPRPVQQQQQPRPAQQQQQQARPQRSDQRQDSAPRQHQDNRNDQRQAQRSGQRDDQRGGQRPDQRNGQKRKPKPHRKGQSWNNLAQATGRSQSQGPRPDQQERHAISSAQGGGQPLPKVFISSRTPVTIVR